VSRPGIVGRSLPFLSNLRRRPSDGEEPTMGDWGEEKRTEELRGNRLTPPKELPAHDVLSYQIKASMGRGGTRLKQGAWGKRSLLRPPCTLPGRHRSEENPRIKKKKKEGPQEKACGGDVLLEGRPLIRTSIKTGKLRSRTLRVKESSSRPSISGKKSWVWGRA